MTLVVPDASVLLKWVLPGDTEADGEKACIIRDAFIQGDIDLKVPSLWLFEAGNTLEREFPEQANELIQWLLDMDLEEMTPTKKWLDHTLALCRKHNVTFYDAAYHAVAITEKGVFVTADEKYVRKAGKSGRVVLLREWV